MESWNFWRLETYPDGRQVWNFTPPGEFKNYDEAAWQSPTGRAFLSKMSGDFCLPENAHLNSSDKIYRHQKAKDAIAATVPNGDKIYQSLFNGVQYYQSLQACIGHWPGDYGGPLFLTPGLIITAYVTESPLPAPQCELIKTYFLNHQNADGGWGLHIEGKSTMFGTVLQYISLRILGAAATDPALQNARKWIFANGGGTAIPPWGKFYLAVLGVYDWSGMNSLLPEMWLLPKGLPFHPSRYWCHARLVYLPMSYCYGKRITATETQLIKELRTELYTEAYTQINWAKARTQCAASDLYYPESSFLKLLNKTLNAYEKIASKNFRKKATDFALDYIRAEDEQTSYINIGPVNQVINSICVWHACGKDSIPFKKHRECWLDYLWLAEDGMKMNGYNGSQLWDTAFATQAILEAGMHEHFPQTVARAYEYIKTSQVKEEVKEPDKYFRHASVGGWPFSTVSHGWPITDCTAEGLKTALQVEELAMIPPSEAISESKLKKACDLILSLQNKDGGWASYELQRAPVWIEALNPSQIFGNIMLDYFYTECTSACVQSLLKFRERFTHYRKGEIEKSILRAIQFILSQQREDGSWYGSWAVCFTYGTWFGVEALSQFAESGIAAREPVQIQSALQKAKQFLLAKQNTDGGWGESFESCIQKKYVPHASSQIINTSWALLALMAIKDVEPLKIEKGIELLQIRQFENGDFPQQGISGVFNHNCAITYTAYRNVFPIWALGRYWKYKNAG